MIEAHLRANGLPARFVYLGILGGTDAAVVVAAPEHVELRATRRGDRSKLAVLASSAHAAERVLAVLADLAPARGERARFAAWVQRALTRTRNLWEALDRAYPRTVLAQLHLTHPRARPMCGHAVVDDEPLVPAYGATVEVGGEHVCVRFEGDTVPVIPSAPVAVPQPARSSTWCDALSWCDPGPCDLVPDCLHGIDCLQGIDLPDCGGFDCDPGCL